MELLTGIISVILYRQFGLSYSLLFYLLFFYTLIVLSFIDISHRVIPNKIMLFLIISGILLNIVFKIIPWSKALTGALVAGVIIYLIRIPEQLVFKKESMGIGLEYSWNENNSPAIILIIDLVSLLTFDKRGCLSDAKSRRLNLRFYHLIPVQKE